MLHLAQKIELNREHFRAIIVYNFRRGLTQQQYIDELNSIFGDEAPSRTSGYWWNGEFNRGRSSLQDEFRKGRPKSVVVPDTFDTVRQLILQDRHMTYRKIETALGISGTSIHSILHDHWTVKKICSRWIDPTQFVNRSKKSRVDWSKGNAPKIRSRCLETCRDRWLMSIYACKPESKQQTTIWVFQNKQNPTKVARTRSTSKQVIACFFGKTGYVAIVPLEQRRTVNSKWYTTICLPVVFQEIRKTNRRRRITLHHDNASSHTSAQTTAFLSAQNIDLMNHPLYTVSSWHGTEFLYCQKNMLTHLMKY